MCNVNESCETAPQAVARGITHNNNKCVKCHQQGIVVTRIHDSFCKDCFRVYIVHKFRSAIGKSKLIRDGEKVLVAFSGGANSAALLHLISDGLSLRAHKKLRFIPTLLHIDEYTVFDNCSIPRLDIQQKISQLMLRSGFEAYITSLEQGLNSDNSNSVGDCQPEDDSSAELCVGPTYWEASSDINMLHEPSTIDVEKLKSVFASLSSLSCKEDFLRNFRNRLIVTVGRKLGFNKVLTAECSSRLSVRILTDIALGRGSQVCLDTGFSDSRNEDVMFVRPIRDLTSKEVVMYNNMFDIPSIFLPTFTTKATTGSSIEHLTESFVTGLQTDFPSTTSNIIRTSEKLSQASAKNCVRCSFCKSFLDTNVASASALNAILFSKNISHYGRDCQSGDDQAVNMDKSDAIQGASTDVLSMGMSDVMPQLCFGCRLSIQDFSGDLKSLPFIHEAPKDQKNETRDDLRSQIADFLIDDHLSSSNDLL